MTKLKDKVVAPTGQQVKIAPYPVGWLRTLVAIFIC